MDDKKVLDELNRRIAKAGTAKAFANEVGLSAVYISDILNGKRDFSDRVLKILGFEKRVKIVKAKGE